MEDQHTFTPPTLVSERAEIVTTRPFRSVREAVAVFGERLLPSDTHSQKSISSSRHETVPKPIYAAFSPPASASFSSSSTHFTHIGEDEAIILSSLKKLEDELEETKQELTLLKERESETEMTVASLNAELQKSISRLAEIEAEKSANGNKASEEREGARSDQWGRKTREMGYGYLPSFAEVLGLGASEDDFSKWQKTPTIKKKKPIVPLISDLFSRRKDSGESHSSLYRMPFKNS